MFSTSEWSQKASWNYGVLRNLLGPASDTRNGRHGYAMWNYYGPIGKLNIFGAPNPLTKVVVFNNVGRVESLNMMVHVKDTGIDGGAVGKIYPGLYWVASTQTIGVVTDCVMRGFLALAYGGSYLTGKYSLRDATDHFIQDNISMDRARILDEKMTILKKAWLDMVAALELDVMETFVNTPGYLSNNPLNVALEEEQNRLFYRLLEAKNKRDNYGTQYDPSRESFSADPRRNRDVNTRRYHTGDLINYNR